jgi:ribosome-binding ATPase YchF (GTP1/OBG family)
MEEDRIVGNATNKALWTGIKKTPKKIKNEEKNGIERIQRKLNYKEKTACRNMFLETERDTLLIQNLETKEYNKQGLIELILKIKKLFRKPARITDKRKNKTQNGVSR